MLSSCCSRPNDARTGNLRLLIGLAILGAWMSGCTIGCDKGHSKPSSSDARKPSTPAPATKPVDVKLPPISGLPAGVTADETQTEYDVTGLTAAAHAAEMAAKGPRLPNGTVYKHYTEWNIEWHFDRSPGQGTCRLVNPRVIMKDKVILPRWIAPPNAPAYLIAKWDAFRKAAATHEGAHRGIVAGVAASIGLYIVQASGLSCDAVAADVNTKAKALLDTAFASEKELDARTRHGKLEGAVFP